MRARSVSAIRFWLTFISRIPISRSGADSWRCSRRRGPAGFSATSSMSATSPLTAMPKRASASRNARSRPRVGLSVETVRT